MRRHWVYAHVLRFVPWFVVFALVDHALGVVSWSRSVIEALIVAVLATLALAVIGRTKWMQRRLSQRRFARSD
jgi:hypothetical protein